MKLILPDDADGFALARVIVEERGRLSLRCWAYSGRKPESYLSSVCGCVAAFSLQPLPNDTERSGAVRVAAANMNSLCAAGCGIAEKLNPPQNGCEDCQLLESKLNKVGVAVEALVGSA